MAHYEPNYAIDKNLAEKWWELFKHSGLYAFLEVEDPHDSQEPQRPPDATAEKTEYITWGILRDSGGKHESMVLVSTGLNKETGIYQLTIYPWIKPKNVMKKAHTILLSRGIKEIGFDS